MANDTYLLVKGLTNNELFYSQAIIVSLGIDDFTREMLAITPTGYGKSFLFGLISNIRAGLDHRKVSVIAPDLGKADIIMGQAIDHLVNASPEIRDGLLQNVNKIDKLKQQVSKTGLSWSGGGLIKPYSASESKKSAIMKGQGMIGVGGDDYLIDESAMIGDENYAVAIRRITENEDGNYKLLEITNPHQMGHAWESYNDPDVAVIHINYETAIEEGRFDPKNVQRIKDKMRGAKREWRIYYECEWIDDNKANSLFDGAYPEEAEVPKLSSKHAGLDCAYKGKDDIRLVTLGQDGDNIHLIGSESFKPDEWTRGKAQEIAQAIVGRCSAQSVDSLGIDVGGNGALLYELIADLNPSFAVYEVNFGTKPTPSRVQRGDWQAKNAYNKRAEIYLDIVNYGASNTLFYNRDLFPELIHQMQNIHYTINAGRYLLEPKEKVIQRTGHSPDELDALAIAVHSCILYDMGETGEDFMQYVWGDNLNKAQNNG